MKVELKFISKDKAENAILNLHEENKRKDEMISYLESSGIQNEIIAVTKNGKNLYLSCEEIYYLEAEQNVRMIYTKDENYHSKLRLYELEKLLPHQFVRISKSEIMNLNYVCLYKPLPNGLMAAQLKNESVVYISRKYLKGIMERLDI